MAESACIEEHALARSDSNPGQMRLHEREFKIRDHRIEAELVGRFSRLPHC